METQILILNSGSSSLKFQVLAMPSETRICQGMVERIGAGDARLHFRSETYEETRPVQAPDHGAALERIVDALLDGTHGVLRNTSEIAAVGHRVVHGGTRFSDTTPVTPEVREAIAELSRLAPLHNPHNLEGIRVAEALFPEARQVAVFDTAFHRTIPLRARKYALPEELYQEHGVQVYGFHGTSHKYVSQQVADRLPPDGKLISLHLGNGCSITAIRGGKSVDHSLGFTPSGGLVMGTRSGDIDHGIVFYLTGSLGYTPEQAEALLTRQSGLLGLTGYSDLRDVEREAGAGNEACRLALEISAYRIRKYIGAYTAVLNGLDGLVFTAGIGEHSFRMRELVCTDLEALGIVLDPERNRHPGPGIQEIQASRSRVKIWVVPTDEELEIARQAFAVLG